MDVNGLSAMINSRKVFLLPYLSAGITAMISVSFYKPTSFDNYYEAFMFPIFLPVLLLPRQIQKTANDKAEYVFSGQKALLIIACVLLIVFILTLGRGMKF